MRMNRTVGALIATLGIALGTGCSSSPTTPTEKALTLFVDRDYHGSWHDVTGDIPNLSDVRGPCGQDDNSSGDYDDCISSIRVSPGWVATGYRDRNYSGPTFEITGDIPNLKDIPGICDHGFDDCLSSIRVRKQ